LEIRNAIAILPLECTENRWKLRKKRAAQTKVRASTSGFASSFTKPDPMQLPLGSKKLTGTVPAQRLDETVGTWPAVTQPAAGPAPFGPSARCKPRARLPCSGRTSSRGSPAFRRAGLLIPRVRAGWRHRPGSLRSATLPAAAPVPAQGSTSPVNQHLIKGHADIWKSETTLLCGLPLSAARLFSESLPDILPD